MPKENPALRRPQRARGCDKILRLQRKNLTSHEACNAIPAGHAKDHYEAADGYVFPCGKDGDQQEKPGNREKGIQHTIECRPEQPTGISSRCTVCSAERYAHE